MPIAMIPMDFNLPRPLLAAVAQQLGLPVHRVESALLRGRITLLVDEHLEVVHAEIASYHQLPTLAEMVESPFKA